MIDLKTLAVLAEALHEGILFQPESRVDPIWVSRCKALERPMAEEWEGLDMFFFSDEPIGRGLQLPDKQFSTGK
jgi:hypothetical protein